MSVGALLGFDESQLTVNEREVLRVLVDELGATLTEGEDLGSATGVRTPAVEVAPPSVSFDHVWYWRARLPERKGQRCRVLVRGGKNTILVEFEDGKKVTTSRYAVRPVGAVPEAASSLNDHAAAVAPGPAVEAGDCTSQLTLEDVA